MTVIFGVAVVPPVMLAEGNPGTAAQEYVSVPALLEVDFDASNTNVLTPVWKVLVAPGTAPGPLTVMVIGLVPPPPPPPPGSAVSVKVPVPAGESGNHPSFPRSQPDQRSLQ